MSYATDKFIGDAAKEVGVNSHTIRYWCNEFPQIAPDRGRGNRRVFTELDIKMLKEVKNLLYNKGYKVGGLKKLLRSDNELLLRRVTYNNDQEHKVNTDRSHNNDIVMQLNTIVADIARCLDNVKD